MAAGDYNKFQCFIGDLGLKVHNLNADTLKVYLSNDPPVAATDTTKTNVVEISTGNGYTGPVDIVNTYSQTGGTGNLDTTDYVTITATGDVGPFQYCVIYNEDSASDSLVCWFDYGSPLTLHNGESFKIDFGAHLATFT